MKRSHHTLDKKVHIILESINTQHPYSRHSISPMTFNRWGSFIKSGKNQSGKSRDSAVKTLTDENESLKSLIDGMTIANDALKKR